ncbi:MAG: hypothetical protein KKF27_21600, partial [Gammaproteobacteria bacterium]|nr:hypothetical protein [Gammaproteobacteria bacterium]
MSETKPVIVLVLPGTGNPFWGAYDVSDWRVSASGQLELFAGDPCRTIATFCSGYWAMVAEQDAPPKEVDGL